jgi:AAA domain
MSQSDSPSAPCAVAGCNKVGHYSVEARDALFCWDCKVAAEDEAVFGPEEGSADGSRVVDGATFAFDTGPTARAIWGQGDEGLWVQGEPMMFAAPPGLIKTTLSQQLVLARIGLRSEPLLGYPVTPTEDRLLYIAADRPRQAAHSLRRMVRDDDRQLLAERLVVWRGPLPFDLTKSGPDALASFVAELLATTVVIDSLKDIAVGLSDDAVGAKVNMALQECIAAGIEVITNHHQRKATAENKQPQTLDDVYGSTWLTAGHGSVLLFTGKSGDPVVRMHHVKSPATEVGPLMLDIDFMKGGVSVRGSATLLGLLEAADDGLTVADAARLLYDEPKPSEAQIEKVRRGFERLVKQGVATKKPGANPKDPVRYARSQREAA